MAEQNDIAPNDRLGLQLLGDLPQAFEEFLNDDSMLQSRASGHNANNNDISYEGV